jgi:hypothetical protein
MNAHPTESLGAVRGPWSRVRTCYLITGATVAIVRVGALAWLESVSFGQHWIDIYLTQALYPEAVLAKLTSLTLARLEGVLDGLGFHCRRRELRHVDADSAGRLADAEASLAAGCKSERGRFSDRAAGWSWRL